MKRVVLLLALAVACAASACMTFVAGKKVSATGRVIVGHNEDDGDVVWVKHGIVPSRDWPAGTTLPATRGCCANVPQAAHTLAFFWTEVKATKGDTNADFLFNERGVMIASDSGGNSRERMDDASLLTDGGVKFNLRRAVGERATSARDAVRVIGEMVTTFGYAPSARIYVVADKDEAWLVQVVHGKNFVATRCPDDEVTIMPNLYTVHDLAAWPADAIVRSPDLEENARRKGFWNGDGAFDFAKAYQGSYNWGPRREFEHPNNTGRFRQALRLVTGREWPAGKEFPFSAKPAKAKVGVADFKAYLSAHNPPSAPEKHVRESWSICTPNTIESVVCEFADSPSATTIHLARGQGCRKPYLPLRPFGEKLPAALDQSADAAERLARHVAPAEKR